MLNCDEVLAYVSESPVEDLPPEVQEAVFEHLEVCPDCRTFMAAYDSVAPMVRSALEVEVDEALQAELDAAVLEAIAQSA